MEPLSPRQQEIIDFFASVVDQRGVAPSYREIGSALGIGSTNAVSDHIKALLRKGYLERVGEAGRSRSLRLTQGAAGHFQDDSTVGIPILGRIAAGLPLLAQENYEGTLRLDAGMVPTGGKIFALVVTGDSMIEDGIQDGDYLFVRQQSSARDGQIAVVMVEGAATVKRLFREDTYVRLQPANSSMEPILLDAQSGDIDIVGVAVGVYRRIG